MRLFGRAGRHGRRGESSAMQPGTFGQGAWSTEIPPEATDPAITQWCDPHFVAFESGAPPRGKLFLFLCGSHGIPARQQLVTKMAASMGYHAINLSYPNSWTVGGLCQDSEDADCHGKVRLDILDGLDRSGLVRVGTTNSIRNRLEKLLTYLAATFATQGWSQFLGTGGVTWSSVVVAGHSQGGGQAAIIAKHHTVARVIMFAAPVDYVRAARSHAAWLAQPGATPADRYFGFVHKDEQGFDRIRRCWELLGMGATAPFGDVDSGSPPYDRSQRLVTGVDNIRRAKYHGCVVQDNLTPVGIDGSLVFEPVWRYLLGEDR